MSEIEVGSTQQSGTVETHAAGLTADDAQPAAAGAGAPLPLKEPSAATAPSTEQPAKQGQKGQISAAKLAANRANAKRSTGPTTPEGKENSKFNAVQHGLTARYFPALIQAGSAESEEFETVRTELYDFYQPANAIEELLVEKLAVEYLRYRRLVEREQVLCAHNRPYFLDIVNKLARYQTAINHQLFEAMRELERLQTQRKGKQAEKRESEGASN